MEAASHTTGDYLAGLDANNLQDVARITRETFNPVFDELRESTGGVKNPSTGRYGPNAFDDATNQIKNAKKVIYSPNPASTDALKQADRELAEGQQKLQQIFDNGQGDPQKLAAAKEAWKSAATLDDFHDFLDKAYTNSLTGIAEPSGAREVSATQGTIDPKKFVQNINKGLDQIGSKQLRSAMGDTAFQNLMTVRQGLSDILSNEAYDKKINSAARTYLNRNGVSDVTRLGTAPTAGASMWGLLHILGASNPLTAMGTITAGTIGWMMSHPDQGVQILKLARNAAPIAAQVAKQAVGKDITHVFDPQSGTITPMSGDQK